MKRVIVKVEKTIADVENTDPVSVFSVPAGAVAVATQDAIFMDYLTKEEAPKDAVYVGDMDKAGVVTDVVGKKADLKHHFFGWDREALAAMPEGKPIELEPAKVVK